MVMEWIYRPICGNKTGLKIREDTKLENFPLYCPKCKQESLIEVKVPTTAATAVSPGGKTPFIHRNAAS